MFKKTVSLQDIREGSRVIVRGSFGNGPAQIAVVTGVMEDIKNGFAGIDYLDERGESYWAYLDQVDRVVNF